MSARILSADSLLAPFLVVCLIRLPLTLYLYFSFQHYSDPNNIILNSAVIWKDTFTYISPVESYIASGNYTDCCRMPGFLPLYGSLYYLFGRDVSCLIWVLLQWLFTSYAITILGKWAHIITGRRVVAWAIFIAGSVSSFFTLWDHAIMSDSFSTSLLILSAFSMHNYGETKSLRYIFLSAFCLTAATFLRQINIVIIPIYFGFLLYYSRHDALKILIGKLAAFAIVPVVLFGSWTAHNYFTHHKIIPLVRPINECWSSYFPERLKCAELMNVWGLDLVHWYPDTPAEWFNSQDIKSSVPLKLNQRLTNSYNADSIIAIKNTYSYFLLENDSSKKAMLGRSFMERTDALIDDYSKEKPFNRYFINRIGLGLQFLFPPRLDNLPLPPLSKMKWHQKVFKAFSYIMLLFVSLLALVGSVFLIATQHRSGLLLILATPWAIFVFLSVFLGWIEQRYFVPVYPFFLVIAVIFCDNILRLIAKRFRFQPSSE